MAGRPCVLIVGMDAHELHALRDIAGAIVADDSELLALEVPEGSTDPALAWGIDQVRLHEFDADAGGLGPAVPQPLGEDGDVWKAIVAAADGHDVDVVVIASPRQSWFRRLRVGSAARDLLGHADVPVLAVPENVVASAVHKRSDAG